MSLSVKFVKEKTSSMQVFVVPVFDKIKLERDEWSPEFIKFITHALKANAKFKGGLGDVVDLSLPEKVEGARVILLGLGKKNALDALKAEEAGGKLAAYISGAMIKDAALVVNDASSTASFKADELAAHLAAGAALRSYNFDRYKSKAKDNKATAFGKLSVVYEHSANAKATYTALEHVISGVFQARDLVNMPPNDLYPEAYAQIIKDELKPLGVEIEVLDEKKMLKMGMGAIMAVGQGSARQPRMVVMRWQGDKKSKEQPIAFVGKGVTFDTGGISLKPGAGMDEMKMDMGGSAAVVGLMKTLASRKAKANVVAVVGLAENMPSSNAYRPGDIITSYSGQTIEVLNTDAEGRLVLADCLTHIQKKYSPRMVIDLATLTGAILVALGHEYCGTFANVDSLWKQMDNASARSGEKLWRMPLDEVFESQIKSDVADLQNIGKIARYGGSCTAAAFLQQFIDEGVEWAHMDIAGTAWRKSDQPTVPKFGSGFGVRVLNDLVAGDYEG